MSTYFTLEDNLDVYQQDNTPHENSIFEALHCEDEAYLINEVTKNPKCVNIIDYSCGITLLNNAFTMENVHICKILMKSKFARMNVTDNCLHCTPLMLMCSRGNVELTELLLACPKVYINSVSHNGSTALIKCIRGGSHDCFSLLTSRKDLSVNSGLNPLITAIEHEDPVFVQRLLKLGARVKPHNMHLVNTPDRITSILYRWRSYLPDWTIFNSKMFPLEFINLAVTSMMCFNKIETNNNFTLGRDIKRLLIHYISKAWKPQKDSRIAKKSNNKEIILDAITCDPSCIDQADLRFAVKGGHIDILNICLNNIAKFKSCDGGKLLHIACENQTDKVVEKLLNYKKELNIKSDNICDALYICCVRGNDVCFKLLLNHNKVDINAKNKYGITLLGHASDYGSYDIVTILKNMGAKQDNATKWASFRKK